MELLLTALLIACTLALFGMAHHGDPGTYAKNKAATWFKSFSERDTVLPGGVTVNPDAFPRMDSVTVVADAAAAAGATEITTEALTGRIPQGVSLAFGSKTVATTAQAEKGATTVQVTAVPTGGIDDGATARFQGSGSRTVTHGTLIGRTFAERANEDDFEPWQAGDDEALLVLNTYPDVAREKWVDVADPRSGLIAENFLPGFDDRPAAEVTAIRKAYTTTVGQP